MQQIDECAVLKTSLSAAVSLAMLLLTLPPPAVRSALKAPGRRASRSAGGLLLTVKVLSHYCTLCARKN